MQELEDNDMIGHLEEEALKRRRKIEEMKKKRKQLMEQGAGATTENKDSGVQLPKPKFRSYIPVDEKLKENVLPKASLENGKIVLLEFFHHINKLAFYSQRSSSRGIGIVQGGR